MIKKIRFYFLFIICINVCFLFSPKPRTKVATYCGEYIHISKAGFVLFCDSYQYTFLSGKPSLMLDKNFKAVRQNRPLYIYATHLIGLPIKSITDKLILGNITVKERIDKVLLQKNINEKMRSSPFIKEYLTNADENLVYNMLPFYIAYIILNFVILLSAVLLFDKLLHKIGVHQHIIYFLSIFIISSGIVKAFFFSAHEQMFAFFAPIAILYSIQDNIQDKTSDNLIYKHALLFGILCLAYGSFILFFPCFLIADFLFNDKFFSGKNYLKIIGSAILFIAPTFIWMFICKQQAGYYFNGEVETFREFVWILDAAKSGIGELAYQFGVNTVRFLNPFAQTLPIFIIAWIYVYLRNKKLNNTPFIAYRTMLTLIFFLFLIFFWLLGYYNFRLVYTCVPIMLMAIAIEMNTLLISKKINEKNFFSTLKILTAVWLTWSIFKYGPFPFQ